MKPIVHVIEDDDSLRTAVLRLLGASGYDTLGYASTGEFLLREPADRHGCLLLDVQLPGPSGLELQSALLERGVPLPIVFMTGHADVASCRAALKGGAVDFLEKPVEPETLLDAIGRALSQDERDRAARSEAKALKTSIASLSARELYIFNEVAAGKLNKQIASNLGVTERTVKAHRASLMTKLRVNSFAELMRLAERMRPLNER